MAALNQSNIHLYMRKQTSYDTIDDSAGPWIMPVSSESLTPDLTFGEDGGDTGFRHAPSRDLLLLSGSGEVTMPLRWGATPGATFLWPLFVDTVQSTAVTINVSDTDISFDDADNSVSSVTTANFDSILPGHIIRIAGANTAANNGVFLVDSKPSAGKLVLSWGALVTEIAGATVTMNSVIAREGTTIGYYAFERKFADASTPKFIAFKNSVLDGLTLNSPSGEFSTLALQLMTDAPGSATFKTSTSSLWTNTPVQVESGIVPRSAVHNRRDFRLDGTAATIYEGVSLNLSNNAEIIPHAEELGVDNYSFGDLSVTGGFEFALRSDFALIDKAMSGESFTVSFAIHNTADIAARGDTEAIYVRLTARADNPGDIQRGGRSGTVRPNLSWTAEPTYEASGDPYIIQFARVPAAS